jgi:hypothetical protein
VVLGSGATSNSYEAQAGITTHANINEMIGLAKQDYEKSLAALG